MSTMPPSRSRLDRLTHWSPRPGFSWGAGLLALASLAAAGCRGEQALFARKADAWSGIGGNGLVTGSGGTGNAGGAGTAGHGGSVGTGGVGGAGNNGGGGGTAGQGGSGTGGQQSTGMYGDSCQSSTDCHQGTCLHNFCCNVDCAGTCQTCDSTTGNACTSVASTQDPRSDCPVATQDSCGNKGGCNGAGACILWQAGAKCAMPTTCKDTTSVINGGQCSGTGTCQPNSPVSCNGFLCQSNACLTGPCTDGTVCVTGGFCAAGTCVGTNPNLAGNGDLEYGTTDGWYTIPSGSGLMTSTVAHNGMWSAEQTNRGATYVGPGYYLPTGIGAYNISLWAMQNQVPSSMGLLQIHLTCASSGSNGYYANGAAALMPSGVWVNFSATIDLSTDSSVMSDCFAVQNTTGLLPGLVRNAVAFLNEDGGDKLVAPATTYPNFYVDDLVVTVTDGHNLVGNPNFENSGGFVDGWTTNGMGSGMLSVSTAQHNGNGKNSLLEHNRSLWNTAIRYALTTGAADYAVTFYVMQQGATAHAIQLWAAYSCKGDPANSVRTKAITQTAMLATGNWAALTSTAVAFPPSDAQAGCQMTGAALWVTQADQGTCGTQSGQIECPDLFLDDATIQLTNTPPTD